MENKKETLEKYRIEENMDTKKQSGKRANRIGYWDNECRKFAT